LIRRFFFFLLPPFWRARGIDNALVFSPADLLPNSTIAESPGREGRPFASSFLFLFLQAHPSGRRKSIYVERARSNIISRCPPSSLSRPLSPLPPPPFLPSARNEERKRSETRHYLSPHFPPAPNFPLPPSAARAIRPVSTKSWRQAKPLVFFLGPFFFPSLLRGSHARCPSARFRRGPPLQRLFFFLLIFFPLSS